MEKFIKICDEAILRFKYMGMKTFSVVALLLIIWCFAKPGVMVAEDKGVVAVLPLQIHAVEKPDQAKRLQEMITREMEARGFRAIPTGAVNKHPKAFSRVLAPEELIRIGKDLKANWIIYGSLTQIGQKASLDLKLIDVGRKKPPATIFMVADRIEDLEEAAHRSAISIDNQISGVPQIESVNVKGNRRIEADAILAVVSTKKGDMFDFDQLDKDLRNIYKMGFFKDVNLETEDGAIGKIIIFIVIEKPSIGKIVFEGNKEIKDKKLEEELGIALYSILDENEVKQGMNRMRELYRKKGYYNVEIVDFTEPLPNNEVLLKYIISEHEKIYIREIRFEGNSKYDDDDLKDEMKTKEKGLFSWFTKSGYLDRKKLEFDIQQIISFYHNNGYIKARAGDPDVSYEEDGIVITIEVFEGNQYGIDKVNIQGDVIKPVDELLTEVQITQEEIYSREIVRQDVLKLREIYANEGYAYVEVIPDIVEDDTDYTVDITFLITKGQRVRFEKINIAGNTRTRDKVIRRQLKIIEGEYFSGKDLKRSTQNLHRLDYFEDVDTKTKEGSRDDLMVVDINVKEKPTGSFSAGAGYSSVESGFVALTVSERNLFGRGQRASISGKLGGRTTEFMIRFVEPWFLNKRLSLGLEAYKWEYEYDEFLKDSWGGAVALGIPLGFDEFTTLSVKYYFDYADVSGVSDMVIGEVDPSGITHYLPTVSEEITDMYGTNVTSSMIFGLTRDSRDRTWHTTRGSVNSVSVEYAGGLLGGDVYFTKYIARTEWYFPLFWDTVFLARGRWGFIEKRNGKLPVYQKFRLGGINSVRGFDYGDISPLDPITGDRIGGIKMMNYTAEYRFPLLPEQGVVGLVFFDAGNVFERGQSYSFSGIRKSTGGGIRWYSPIGPFRLEYGWNIDPLAYEKSGRWEFMIGGTF